MSNAYTRQFFGRTFSDVVRQASDWLTAFGLAEITSQWSETAGGWAGIVYARPSKKTREGEIA